MLKANIHPDIDKLIIKRAKELGITLAQAYEIFNIPFGFIKETMNSADLNNVHNCKSVYIKGMGTFVPKKFTIDSYKYREKKFYKDLEEHRKFWNDGNTETDK